MTAELALESPTRLQYYLASLYVPSPDPQRKIRKGCLIMPSLAHLAELVGGQLRGDPALEIRGAATVRDAQAGDLTFVTQAGWLPKLDTCHASAVLLPEGLSHDALPSITVTDPELAFAQIVRAFRPSNAAARTGCAAQATVDPSARIDPTAVVHPGAVIYEEVEIGPRAVVHANVCLMSGCRIGPDSTIFPGAVLYENTVVGARCLVHAGAVLGAYGYGYKLVAGRHVLSVQLGNVVLEDDVEIGACTTIDRGTYGSTTIGEGTKIDNQVMIGHNCRIGRHNLLCSQVGIAGSSSTGDYVVMAGQVGVGDHLEIGHRVTIGAQSGVMHHIDSNQRMLGSPAVDVRKQMQVYATQLKLPELRKQINHLQKAVEDLTAQAGEQRRAA